MKKTSDNNRQSDPLPGGNDRPAEGTNAGSGTPRSTEGMRLVSYLIICLASAGLFISAGTIPTSRWEVLGAGAYPQLVFGGLAVMTFFTAVTSLRKFGLSMFPAIATDAVLWLRSRHLVIWMFILFGAYILTIPLTGFQIATFAFLMASQLLLAPWTPRSFALIVAIAVIFSFGLNYLFAEVFNVFLPRGRL